jgi:AcrR family transcriptional regulator
VTHAQIVSATEALLLAGADYDALSMSDIAAAAGVSRATVYLHFTDKRDIIAAMTERIVTQRFDIGAEIVADPSMNRDEMRAIVTDMTRRWIRDAPLLKAIVRLAEQDPATNQAWVRAIHEVGDMGADLMRQRWESQPGGYKDPTTLGRALAWMFERTAHQLAVDPDQQEQAIEAVTEIVWRVISYQY